MTALSHILSFADPLGQMSPWEYSDLRMAEVGSTRLRMMGHGAIFQTGSSTKIDTKKFRARLAAHPAGEPLLLNVEVDENKLAIKHRGAWHFQEEALRRRIEIQELAIEHAPPGTPIGSWARPPVYPQQLFFEDYDEWADLSTRAAPLAGLCDWMQLAVYPQSWRNRWEMVAWMQAQIDLCRDHYHRPCRVTFYTSAIDLWGRGIASADSQVPRRDWELYLGFAAQHPDVQGITWWGGNNKDGKKEPWNEEATWWQVTRDLLIDRGIAPLRIGMNATLCHIASVGPHE